jgi:hypothetical protein
LGISDVSSGSPQQGQSIALIPTSSLSHCSIGVSTAGLDYTDRTRELMAETVREDIEMFGYEFDGSNCDVHANRGLRHL